MPVINNAYPVDESNYAYSPSDMDITHKDMSRKDINNLIDSLCKTRMENPDVVLMDNIKNEAKFYDPIAQEKRELEQDNIAVEEEILKGIFESDTPMSVEEQNELIANGVYQKYQEMKARKQGKSVQQMAKEDNETMNDIEAELRASMNTPMAGDIEQVTEVISETPMEEITESSFPVEFTEEKESTGTGEIANPVEGTTLVEEGTRADAIKEYNEALKTVNNNLNTIFDKMDPPKLEYDLTEEELNAMANCDTLAIDAMEDTTLVEEGTGMDAESVIDTFEAVRNKPEEKHLSKESIAKIVGGLPTAAAVMANPQEETLEDVMTEFNDTVDSIKNLPEAITANSNDVEEDKPMSVEEFNDVPATEINLPDDVVTSALMEQYDNVTYEEAMQLVDVMNRYKAHEKFNVFEALPMSLKSVILKEAASVGADRSTVNFFAKTFINDLVNNTYLDREIKDFNDELQKAMAPMGNIVGTMMDEYNDEVYDKFTTKLFEKADEIRNSDPEKARQLNTIATNFEAAVTLSRIRSNLSVNNSISNKHYKYARDNWKKLVEEYNNIIANVSPKPRDLDICLRGLIVAGYPEDYAKTIISLVVSEVKDAIENGSLEEHIYAYYLTNSLLNLNYTANNSKVIEKIKYGVDDAIDIIDKYMTPLKMRNTKKNRKRNKRK